jgi:hypothetical protein
MIRKLLSKIFSASRKRRKSLTSRKSLRRIAFEPLETRRLLAAAGAISGFAYLDPSNAGQMTAADVGFAGMTVQLQSVGSSGNLSAVSGVGPTQTLSDGSFSFSGLSAGTYQVQIEPSSKLAVGAITPGSTGGTTGTNDIQLTLADGQASTGNDFAILGAQSQFVSLRMYLASTGSLSHYLANSLHTAPTVQTGDAANPHFSTSYSSGGTPADVTASDASITSPDSPTLVSMTVSIENPLDGNSETLAATTTGTGLSQSYANGTLSITGVADIATYDKVLQSVTYSDSSASAQAGTRTISVVVNDGTDNSNTATSTITVSQGTITNPAVTAVSTTQAPGSYSTGTTIPITITFNKAVTVTGTPQLALNDGGTATYVSGTGTSTLTFNYTVVAGQSTSDLDYASTTALGLSGGTIKDSSGNAATLTLPATGTDGLAAQNIIINTTAPTVTGVSTTQATGAYTAGTTIPITVTFSGPVTVTGTPQLALNDGGTATYASGSGTSTLTFNYLVAAGQNTQDLDYSSTTALGLNGGTIKDSAGNAAVVTLPATATDGLATKNIVIETSAPTVTAVSSTQAAGVYSTGTTIPITVTFSSPVNVTGTPQLTLNDGGTATYASGTGTTTLTFNYVVGSGQNTQDLDYATTGALTLNGGTIQDAAANAATLALPATGNDGLATLHIIIDTTPRNVTAVGTTEPSGAYGVGTTIPITITFGEAVTVTGTPQLALKNGGTATYASGSGGATLTFNYPVAAGQDTNDLDYASTSALTLNGGTILDPAGNPVNLTLPATGTDGLATQNIVIQTTNPTVTAVSTSTAAGSYSAGTTIPITVTFSHAVNVTGTPQLALNDGATAAYVSGSGTATLTFNYSVGAGQNTPDLDYASSSALTLNGGTIQDSVGNVATLTLPAVGTDGLATKQIVIDTTPPVVTAVSSTQAAGAYAAGTTIPITVTFGESVIVTGTPQLALNDGGTATYVSGSGTATLTFHYVVGSGQNTQDLDYASTGALTLNGGTIKDAAGNDATLTLPATGTDGLADQHIVIDTTPRNVTAVGTTQPGGAYGVGTAMDITVTFGEAMTVTGTPQLALNDGGTAFYASGSGTDKLTFIYTVASGENTDDLDYASTSALSLNGGSIVDPAGNPAVLTLPATGTDGLAAQNIAIQTTPPTVTGASSSQPAGSYTTGTTIPITLTFTHAVNVTGTPKLALNDGGTADYVSGSGTTTLTFNYVVAAGQNTNDLDYASTSALTLNGGSIVDTVGNVAVLTLPVTHADGLATKNIGIDTTAPTVTAVSTTQAAGAYAAGATIPITVTFNEAVTVTGTPQIALNDGGTASYVSGSGTATLTFNYLVGSGENTQDLDYTSTSALSLNGGSIADAAGNAATLTLPATATDGLATKNIIIDTTPRNVTAVGTTKPSGTYGTGTTIPITVTFGEAVNVTGTPKLALNDGGTASYVSGSGTATLTFSYTVASGDNTSDLDYASTAALTLNGGTIVDPVGNPAILTLPATGTNGLATQNIVIVTAPPAVTGVSSTTAAGAYSTGTTIPITVTFNHAVTVTGTPHLTLNDGGTATYASGTGTATLTFNYVVAAGQSTADLDYSATTALTLNGGTIEDAVGNAAALTLPATGTDGLANQHIVIDTTVPAVTGVSTTKATGTYGHGATIPITVTFGEAVTVTGTPQLALNDGGTASYASGSGTTVLTFNYTPLTGESTADLDYASTAALTLNGGSIQDAASNAAVLTLPATGTDGLATKNIVINTTAPQFNISASPVAYNKTNVTNAGFIFSGNVVVGETYNYTVTSTGGTGQVTGSGTVTSATQTVSGINLSSLVDGTLSFNVTLTDSLGNVGTASSSGSLLRSTVVPDQTVYTPTSTPETDTSLGFTLNTLANQNGATYSYSFLLNGSPTSVRGSGTVNLTSMHISPIDISSLPSGVYTLHLVITPVNGAASNTNASVTHNRPIPAFTVTPLVPFINGPNTNAAGFTIVGGEPTTTYKYVITGSNGGGPAGGLTGSGSVQLASQKVFGVNVSSFNDGTLTYSVTLTDLLGNTLTEQATAVLDRVAPAGYSISNVPAAINAPDSKNTSFTLNSPSGEIGDTYVYTITSSGTPTAPAVTGSGTVTATAQQITGINVSTLPDGTLSFSVVLTDQAGNAGASTTPVTATLNTVAPGGYSLATDQTIIATKAAAANTGFTIISPASENGDTFTWTTSVTVGNPPVAFTGPSGTGTISTTAQDVTGIDVSSLPDGTVTYSVRLTNAVGNPGPAATNTSTLDTTAPSGFTITPDQSTINAVDVPSSGFTIGGAAVGDIYNFSITDGSNTVTGSGTMTAASQDITGINLTSLAAGTITYSLNLTDIAGHSSTIPATNTATIDPSAPTAIALSSSSTVNSPNNLVGLLETVGPHSGSSYTYSLVSGAGSTDNGSFVISGNKLLTGPSFDGSTKTTFDVRMQSTDSAGKSIQQQFLITVGADTIGATLVLSNSTVANGQPAGVVVGNLTAGGAVIGNQVTYSLVSEPGTTDNNSSFQIVGNQLQTSGPLAPGTYTVHVRSSSTFLISDVVDLSNVNGPTAFQVSYDPAVLPSDGYRIAAANAGLITLATDGNGTGNWIPAVSGNHETAGSLAQPNFLGPYNTFWSNITTANPTAALKDVVGSSGVDLTGRTAWAVIDQPGEYAVSDTVFTEQVFTITVT